MKPLCVIKDGNFYSSNNIDESFFKIKYQEFPFVAYDTQFAYFNWEFSYKMDWTMRLDEKINNPKQFVQAALRYAKKIYQKPNANDLMKKFVENYTRIDGCLE